MWFLRICIWYNPNNKMYLYSSEIALNPHPYLTMCEVLGRIWTLKCLSSIYLVIKFLTCCLDLEVSNIVFAICIHQKSFYTEAGIVTQQVKLLPVTTVAPFLNQLLANVPWNHWNMVRVFGFLSPTNITDLDETPVSGFLPGPAVAIMGNSGVSQ